jgi:flavin reductase (DIM6/NTAB) family NADH-FMN oxidoreductase RutF
MAVSMHIQTPLRQVAGAELRAAIGHFATGVSVVTSATHDGRPIGSTANALSSVSLDPPLVLVCLREESETLGALLDHGRFAINVLAGDQLPLAERFASRSRQNTWEGVGHRTSAHGVPLLDGTVATLECALHDIVDGGDHRIVIGRVLEVEHPEAHVSPLVFYRGAFSHLPAPPEPHPPRRADTLPTSLPEVFIPTRDGDITLVPVEEQRRATTSVIALVGQPRASSGSLVYLHRGCFLGDALGHLRCRRGLALREALQRIRAEGTGVVVYHRDDASPFAGCCIEGFAAGSPRRAPAEETMHSLRRALTELQLHEVRLLRCRTEPDPLAPFPLNLDVAVIEPFGLDH